MNPSDIQPGRKYRLVPRYTIIRKVIVAEVRRVEEGNVIVPSISGREVSIPLREFAAMAREEVS